MLNCYITINGMYEYLLLFKNPPLIPPFKKGESGVEQRFAFPPFI